MLGKETKERIQALYRECITALDLRPRYGQRVMIAEIAKSLGSIHEDEKGARDNDAGIVVVEAGTGTGKTLAYLLAALPIAIERADINSSMLDFQVVEFRLCDSTCFALFFQLGFTNL
mgnify:CR=1 FL=1